MEYKRYKNELALSNKLYRLSWNLIYPIFFRPFRLPQFNFWRIFLLRLFGAKIGQNCKIHATVKVWSPSKLIIGDLVAIGFDVLLYNPGQILIGNKITISQRAHLCSASHDISLKSNPLIIAPIVVEDRAWIAADAFIGMGVTISQGAVVGGRASVFKNIEPWTVVGGNPAKFIKNRVIND